jgi:hypothetical protein
MPLISTLNLRDNNLTDVGLTPLIKSFRAMSSLTHLDLSSNVIDGRAAKALAKYLSATNCPLQHLIMQKADIDDDECQSFVKALIANTTLLTLDMSVWLCLFC